MLTVALSHTTIAVSEQTKKELTAISRIQKKVVVIYNGVSIPYFYSRAEARQKMTADAIKETDMVIGTIAELHKNKGLTYAIEAFSRVSLTRKNLFFVIIGSGEEKDQLYARVSQKKLNEKIFFFESSEANRYLKAFDIFILPSIKEGLPYTILEAGCARLPVIASRVGGIQEIIEHHTTGLLTSPKDVDDIERALVFFIENSSQRISFGEKLCARVQHDFSTQSMVEKTLLYYNESVFITTQSHASGI